LINVKSEYFKKLKNKMPC